MYCPGSILSFPSLAVDCVGDEWTHGECSTTCGSGYRLNTRVKLVEEANGGSCTGQSTETEECNLQKCPGIIQNQKSLYENGTIIKMRMCVLIKIVSCYHFHSLTHSNPID